MEKKKNVGFMVPPNHVNFLAKKLFGEVGEVTGGSVAYIEKNGGGPVEKHTHGHDHLFIVIEGEVRILLDTEEVVVRKNESYLVKGEIPHSVWNDEDVTAVVVGLTVKG